MKNVEIYNESKIKLTKNLYSFPSFFVFKMCQNCQVSNTVETYELKLSKNQKERIITKSHLFCNSFSVDEIDVLSELL